MASNEVEVLDPKVTVENPEKTESGVELNRRHLLTALGVAGAVAAVGLLSHPSADAQQPVPNGYNQVDVLNFLLSIKYLKATLYSYAVQSADLPGSTGVSLGTGGVFNAFVKSPLAPANLAVSQQIADLFNEMYYDELNHLVALRGLLGTSVANRPTINLLGTGTTTTATATPSVNTVIGLARMLEDISVSAFAGAASYLNGTNLSYAQQVLAVDGFHAGALRLTCIQNNIPYLGTSSLATANNAQVSSTFSGSTFLGSPTILTLLSTIPPTVGNTVSGVGIPEGAVITAVAPAQVYTGNIAGSAAGTPPGPTSIITNLSTVAGLSVNQTISGAGIPANSLITAINPVAMTVTIANAFVTPTSAGTPAITTTASNVTLTPGFAAVVFAKGSNQLTSVSTFAGLVVGMPISGANIPGNTIITAMTAGTPGVGSITMSANSSGGPTQVQPTGVVIKNSAVIQQVSSLAGVAIGQPIVGPTTGSGIAAGSTVTTFDANAFTITMSKPATGDSTATLTGILTKGSDTVTGVSSLAGLNSGLAITGTGIPAGTTIKGLGSINSLTLQIGLSQVAAVATVSSPLTPNVATFTGVLTQGSNIITAIPTIPKTLVVGVPLNAPGIPDGTTVTAVPSSSAKAPFQITISAPNGATANSPFTAPTVTLAGVITASSPIVTQLASVAGIATGMAVSGAFIPLSAYVTAVDPVGLTVTMSVNGTGSLNTVPVTFYTPQTIAIRASTTLTVPQAGVTLTIPTVETVTPGLGTVTISQNATASGGVTLTQPNVDVQDVEPADPGTVTFSGNVTSGSPTIAAVSSVTGLAVGLQIVGPGIPVGTTIAALSAPTITLSASATASTAGAFLIVYPANSAVVAAGGPSLVPGSSPAVYHGFFNTAGSATGTASSPAGFEFARTFSQALAALYGGVGATTNAGGFFPNGITSTINQV